MNNLTVFNNPDFGSIRTVTINNEPYFVGKDVADVLEYRNGSRDINRHVDEEDRGVSKIDTLGYTNAPKAIKDHVDDEDKLVERIVMSGQK